MGSYISIYNDTKFDFRCKLGLDHVALRVASVFIVTIGLVATAFVSVKLAAFAATKLFGATGQVFGMSVASLAQAGKVSAIIATTIGVFTGTASLGVNIARYATDNMTHDGFVLIPAGNRHRYDKMPLALLKECVCIRAEVMNDTMIRLDTVDIRPIISSAFVGKTNLYGISTFLDPKHVTLRYIIAQNLAAEMHEPDPLQVHPPEDTDDLGSTIQKASSSVSSVQGNASQIVPGLDTQVAQSIYLRPLPSTPIPKVEVQNVSNPRVPSPMPQIVPISPTKPSQSPITPSQSPITPSQSPITPSQSPITPPFSPPNVKTLTATTTVPRNAVPTPNASIVNLTPQLHSVLVPPPLKSTAETLQFPTPTSYIPSIDARF